MTRRESAKPPSPAGPEQWIERGASAALDGRVDEHGPARSLRDGKVIEGRGGRLFIANDHNQFLRQLSGELRLAKFGLERWREVLEHRISMLRQLGARYVFMVAPDSHSVFPRDLPKGVEVVSQRPVHQIAEHLEQTGSEAGVIYPLEELLTAAREQPIYSLTDSHWNDYGGFVAYRRILRELGPEIPVRRLELDDVEFDEQRLPGDLGFKLTPPVTSPHFVARMVGESARLVFDNCVDTTGAHIVTECPAAPASTCVLFGDSFSYPVLKFFAESFRRFVFVHSSTVDPDVVRRERPHAVVSLMAERFMIEVPFDLTPGALRDAEHRKKAEDRLRMPLSYWPGPLIATPPIAELLRSHYIRSDWPREATIVSAMAYAGLRPAEITELRWTDVSERDLRIGATPDREGRTVELFRPLADDLRDWRKRSAPRAEEALVFPGQSGGEWDDGEWGLWDRYLFKPIVEIYDATIADPYDLHEIFGLLLLARGASVDELSRQLGEPVERTWAFYRRLVDVVGQLAAEPAEREIWRARHLVFTAAPQVAQAIVTA
jgi:alginate O-acetyltransferase complex protein AlgJ